MSIYRARRTHGGIELAVEAPPGPREKLFATVVASILTGVVSGVLGGGMTVLCVWVFNREILAGSVGLGFFLGGGAFFGLVGAGGKAGYATLLGERSRPLEALLPQSITFRQDGLVVVGRDGTVEDVGWSWLCGARDVGGGIHFNLAHDARVSVFLAANRIDAEELHTLRAWLKKNGQLADARGRRDGLA